MVSDFILSFFHNPLQLGQLDSLQSLAQSQLNHWLQPELGLAVGRQHMHVHPRLLSGKEVKAVIPVSKNRRTHLYKLTDPKSRLNRHFEVNSECPSDRRPLARADFVITTGGLDPTSDDLTRGLVAQLLRRPLREDEAVRAHTRQFFNPADSSLKRRGKYGLAGT
jgi:hypothetical protein